MIPTEQKLRDLLNELFRFDRSDLDFGIYRIMNLKRDEVQHFIDADLLPQIRQVLKRTDKEQNGDLETQLDKAREAAKAAGLTNPDEAPKVKELLGKYRTGQAVEEQERQVFGHLYEFFHRYYKDGDFIPQARYKKGVYALPYEGEEVKLSWANQDQYYIKSAEELRDYSFTLSDKRLVRLRVVQAEEDRDNNKSQQDKDQRLILASDKPVAEENGELVIRFEYRPDEDTRKQDEINDATVATIIANSAAAKWKVFLQAQKPGSDKGVLAYHLRQYTARNTFDYFIHKDLDGFLRRELDLYLKNEVLDLDTLAEQGAEQSLRRQFGIARAVQQVGGKVIDFLAQLENFQKKLWLKKKFVVRTDWCVTLDRVPHELYAQVAANTEQVEEWKCLFAVQDIQGDTTTPRFTEPPSILFLEHNPHLVVDTRFFDQAFKDKLLTSFSNLDEQTDGLLIHSENFQALELLQERYRQAIKCIHIDPPYNTQTSGFLYKNGYEHSSWLAMMQDRVDASIPLLVGDGAYLCHIDENEYEVLYLLFEQTSLPGAGTIVWDKMNPMLGRKGVATQHEYIIWRSRYAGLVYLRNGNVGNILAKAASLIKQHGGVTPETRRDFAKWIASLPGLTGGERAYRLIDDEGSVYQSVAMGAPEPRTDPKFHIPLIHPVTGKACPVPAGGWSRSPETLRDLMEKGEIVFGETEATQPRRKVFLTEESKRQLSSVVSNASRGKGDALALGISFPYCHPASLYEQLLGAAAPDTA